MLVWDDQCKIPALHLGVLATRKRSLKPKLMEPLDEPAA